MATERDRTPDANKGDEVGPGAAMDEVVERETGAEPGERAPGTSHAAPGAHVEAEEPSEHSYWPIVVAGCILVIGIGFLTHPAVAAIGAVALLAALVGWFSEPWVS